MRRLRWAAAAVVLAVAGCGGGQAPVTRDAVAAADTVTTAGTVTGPTGSVKGVSYAGLTDAYTGNYGGSVATVEPQWQHAVLLSDTPGACGRSGAGEPYAANEVTLRFTLVGYATTAGQLPPVQPPAADLPLTFPATGTWVVPCRGSSTRGTNAGFAQSVVRFSSRRMLPVRCQPNSALWRSIPRASIIVRSRPPAIHP